MSYVQKGMSDIYNPGYGTGRRIHRRRGRQGGGFFDTIKKGLKWAKDNQIATKALNAANSLGLTDRISQHKLGALALKGLQKAQEHGYGRRRGRRTGGRRRRTAAVGGRRRRRRY
jgi:hypothetical protein